ncbi:MAG: PHP domain-containing protein [Phenylobacterium sp.]|uniref:CehA/McbA family metallohydrolase n=1 Tax=Phenylobacterium sp. TaxID=1871053 RepID=UPI0025EE1368|nr:CehA/McbA family metallohydrolase [Phenylobacterium sp.]MBI1197724.1 PHP domain-containing protein [Phenylobacterium sp.]
MRAWAQLAAALALLAAPACAQDITLTGAMTGADHQTYREVPFRVPEGVTSVTVDFDYTGRDQKSVIDLGLRDPVRFRGWSGGNKASFTLTETWATPSYLPGPLPAGEWKLILGVPNLRKDARADYTAKITFGRGAVFHGFAAAPLKAGPGWYRGDLHLHTGHSDGSCPSKTGKRTPCPLFLTLAAAEARGLDFVAVTEHNTSSHIQDLAELQGYFDDLLLIPGREVTTFKGHANVFGMTGPLDFQLGSPRAPGLGAILDEVEAAHALISINHPALPSGEACMGCGWTATTDYARIPSMEAINGMISSGPLSGVGFWEKRLDDGFHITAVGGSDNHDATLPPDRGVGRPTTVVHAQALSQDAVLAAIRAGHVFVDALGTRDRLLEVTANAGGATAEMGDRLPDAAGATLRIHVAHAAGGRLAFAGPAAAGLDPGPPLSDAETRAMGVPAGAKGWLRVDVRGPDGALWLLGNPIWFGS